MVVNKNSYTILLQYENCDVHFSQYPINYNFDSNIYDRISVYSKVILSNYKKVKRGDNMEIIFYVEPALLSDKCKPEAFGEFSKKLSCVIYVPPTFPERLDFILNRGIKPYFDLGCIQEEKYRKPTIKTFSMQSKINMDDYLESL